VSNDIKTIADLLPDPRNARKHNPRNIGTIVDSMQSVGASRSIVIDEAGVILAGNGAVEAAGEAGITKVQVVDADGETIIAVRRTGLTEEQKRKLAIADNRTSDLSEWDAVRLLAEIESGLDMQSLGFTEDELDSLLGALVAGPVDDSATADTTQTQTSSGENDDLVPFACGTLKTQISKTTYESLSRHIELRQSDGVATINDIIAELLDVYAESRIANGDSADRQGID
jgi:hypothetical protein